MKTFSFFDYGLTPSYQCTVDAEDLEDAQRQVAEAGRPLHRLTAVLGIRLAGFIGGRELENIEFTTHQCISRQATLAYLKGFKSEDELKRCDYFCWAVRGQTESAGFFPVRLEIDDLKAEFAKYDVPYYPS